MPRRTKASLQALTAPLLALLLAPCGADVDLTGLWTGSPSGSPKEILLAQRDPDAAADSASFELVCRTTDYMTSSPCGWTSARCTVAGDAVTCTLPVGSGTANAAGDQIMFSGGPDNKFTGGLSGIWASASDKGVDAYLMLHNATTNAVVVWWDTGVTPNTGPWAWGAGVYTPANRSLLFTTGYLSTLQSSVFRADLSAVASGGLSGWAKKPSQIIRPPPPVPPPPPCKDALGCSLNGECRDGVCTCDKGWKGQVCGELDLMPVDKAEVGLFINGTTTWGGTPIVTTDPKTAEKTYHLYVIILYSAKGVAYTYSSIIMYIEILHITECGDDEKSIFQDYPGTMRPIELSCDACGQFRRVHGVALPACELGEQFADRPRHRYITPRYGPALSLS